MERKIDMTKLSEAISRKIDELRPEITRFLQQLVQQRSLPGQEQAAQALVAAKLEKLDMDVSILKSELADLQNHSAFSDDGVPFLDRLNVVATWTGSDRDARPTLLLNGHLDVVPAGEEELWTFPPWEGVIENGKLHGRGACDMKAGVTAAIFACQALREMGYQPQRSLTLETVIGEESGGIGALTTLLKGILADAAIIMEPTRLGICPVQSGALSFRIGVSGRAIHASMKIYGVSAVANFYVLFQALEHLDRERHARYRNPLFEHPQNIAPISIGKIQGGNWPSTVPDELVAEGRFGILPGESLAAARAEFAACLEQAAAFDPWLKDHPPTLEWFEGQFESSVTSMDEPIARCLSACHQELLGNAPPVYAVPYGSDQRLFTNVGNVPTILYGPGDVAFAHTVDEFVPLEEVFTCARVLALTVMKWCGGSFKPPDDSLDS